VQLQTTTTRYKPAGPKPFAWSYSKLKNFEVCPKRHYNVDVIKSFKEEEGEALVWGNMVHKALADRCVVGKGVAAGQLETAGV